MKKILGIVLGLIFSFGVSGSVFGEESCSYEVVSEKYDNISDPIYSSDGKSYIFTKALKNGKSTLIKDGKNIGSYDGTSDIIYSPDSKSFIFSAIKGGIYNYHYYPGYDTPLSHNVVKKGYYSLVVNGEESGKYDYIDSIIYSNDSKDYSFIAEKKGEEFVVINNIEGDKYISIDNLQYVKGIGFIYTAEDHNGVTYLIKNGKNIIKEDINNYIKLDSDKYILHDIYYSKNGSRMAIRYYYKGLDYLLIDGRIYSKYDGIEGFTFSPDGKKYAYIANLEDGKKIVIENGNKYEKYDDINYLQYSGNSSKLIYIATSGNYHLIVYDGIKSKKYNNIDYYEIYNSPAFSTNGDNFAYSADGSIFKNFIKQKYNGYYPIFSTDGESFSYLSNDNGNWSIIKDGELIKNDLKITNISYIGDTHNLIYFVDEGNGGYIAKEICNKINIKSNKLFSKGLILSSKNLKKLSKGEIYKGLVDKRVSSLDDKKLIAFHNLLGKIDLDNSKYKKYKLVLEYMRAKIGLEIWSREGIEKQKV